MLTAGFEPHNTIIHSAIGTINHGDRGSVFSKCCYTYFLNLKPYLQIVSCYALAAFCRSSAGRLGLPPKRLDRCTQGAANTHSPIITFVWEARVCRKRENCDCLDVTSSIEQPTACYSHFFLGLWSNKRRERDGWCQELRISCHWS
jgi:hypothetical protein